jgi:hypothetical protein
MTKTKAPRPYYTLVVIDGSPGCPWSPEFGDRDKAVVQQELEDWIDRGWKRRELKIITTGGTEAEIMAAVAKLNEEI